MKSLIARFATKVCGTEFLAGWLMVERDHADQLRDAKRLVSADFKTQRVLDERRLEHVYELVTGQPDKELFITNQKRFLLNNASNQESAWFAAHMLLAPYCNVDTAYPEQELYLARGMISKDLEKGNSHLPHQKALANVLVTRLPLMPLDIARAVADVVYFTAKEFHHKKTV